MNDVIARTIDLINQTLNSSSKECSQPMKSQLVNTRNNLNRLLDPTLLNDDWTRLYCRQLKRFIDSKRSSTENCWIEIHNDIEYILERANGNKNQSYNWINFVQRMKLESKLEERQIKFERNFEKQKSLNELYDQHEEFVRMYFQQCISLHSKIEINGVIENIDDFLYNVCELSEPIISPESRKTSEKNLKYLKINFNCQNRLLRSLRQLFFEYNNADQTNNTTITNYLPSMKQLPFEEFDRPMNIETMLRVDRWIVILGDPGSAKTTLLRWITQLFAREAYDYVKKVYWTNSKPCRIPILIRIGEFATWLEDHPSKTLIDYIGKHTWFSQIYCNEKYENSLKEFVYHGHALILLDGLDEISDMRHRGKIANIVEKFIDEYTCTSEYISPFDDEIYETYKFGNLAGIVFDIPYPKNSTDNQIIITSRIVGYQMNSIFKPSIIHYTLLPIKDNQAKQFIDEWILQVKEHIFEVFKKELFGINRQKVEILLKNRSNAIKTMVENCSESLIWNSSLLSLICIFIFQSSDQLSFKSRIEIYHYAIESTLYSWNNKKSRISKSILFNFLIDLATYLQLQSSSGLIDAFDIEHLCYSTIKKSNLFNNREEIRNYSKELISLLDSNIGIIVEKGLQVYGFQHLTFQEYFVSQSLIRYNSIDDIVKNILLLTTNPRFREPLILAIGFISWKWSFENYEKFSYLLISTTKDYAIPFGTLIFFDAFNDLEKLPSNSIIYTALNILFDHFSEFISTTYLILNLLKLSKDIIVEWMKSRLIDEKSLSKFCQFILINISKSNHETNLIDIKLLSSIVYESLWSLHNINSSTQLIIDQTLRKIVILDKFPDDICSYVLSEHIFDDNIHPLILSVIIAVCGGIHIDNVNHINKIRFSTKSMHRPSSIMVPIIDYLTNKNECHSVKVQKLIKQYENILENVLLNDVSVNIIDTFMALICLQGLSQPLIYQKYDGYYALSIAIDRLKQIWFYLNKLFDYLYNKKNNENKCYLESEIETIINEFFSKSNQSDEELITFSLSCAAAWQKLGIDSTSNWLKFDIFHRKNLDRYLECQPEFIHFITERKVKQMNQNIHSLQIFQHEPLFLLTFLPQSLQPLYQFIMITQNNNNISSTIVVAVLLSHCLISLNEICILDMNLYLAVFMLLPYLEEYLFENYALILFERGKFIRFRNEAHDEFFQAINNCNVNDQPKDWKILIDIERQRIFQAKNEIESDKKDLHLFAASICLSGLINEFRLTENSKINNFNFSSIQGEIYSAIINIDNPILRIIALTIVLDNGKLFIFDEEQRNIFSFNEEQRNRLTLDMINQFECLLPNLSLSISTLLLIRCHRICLTCRDNLQSIVHTIGEKLNETLIDKSIEEQEVVFIALLYLNNPDLSKYLIKFSKRTNNLSDLLHFNSTIFFKYFINNTFDSTNPIFLSSFYLTELSFDAQILKMYSNSNIIHTDILSPLEKLNQMWSNLSNCGNIMTFEIASWITDNLHILDKAELDELILQVCRAIKIKKKAYSIIKNWLSYRMNKDLKFLAYYAALQMIGENFDVPDLSIIIKEIFTIDTKFYLQNIIENVFMISTVNSMIIRQFLINLHENIRYSTKISVWIKYKEIFQLILSLEFERINSNTSKYLNRPYLLMINGGVENFEVYLKEYLLEFMEIGNKIKERHVAIIIKWIITMPFIRLHNVTTFSIEFYEWICTFLYQQRFPQVQRAIINGINSVFIHSFSPYGSNKFFQDNINIHFEKIIYSWKTYSQDILDICLLAYANYILKYEEHRISRNIGEEIQSILMTIFETSSSEIISIRAAYCLIFSNHSNIRFRTIFEWFETKKISNINQRYNILLQLSLYNNWNRLSNYDTEVITQLIDRFILDFCNYLSNKENLDYLADPTPKYVDIALEFFERNIDIFHNALKKSNFGIEKFQKEYSLYFYQTNNSIDRDSLIKFYILSNRITNELIDMIKWIQYVEDNNGWKYLENVKQISDRDIIESIFECLDLMTYDEESQHSFSLFKSIVQIAQTEIISVLEVHQHILHVINHYSWKNNYRRWQDEKEIFDLLLNMSSIKKISTRSYEKKLFTQNDIDKKFESLYQSSIRGRPLFLRRDYFFTNYRSIMNSSK